MVKSYVYMRHVHRQVKKLVAGSSFFSFCFFFSLNHTDWKYRCVNREQGMIGMNVCIFVHACKRSGELLESMTWYFAASEYKKKRTVTINQNRWKDRVEACLSVRTYETKPNGNLLLTFTFFSLLFFRLSSFCLYIYIFGPTYLFAWFVRIWTSFLYAQHTQDRCRAYIYLFF